MREAPTAKMSFLKNENKRAFLCILKMDRKNTCPRCQKLGLPRTLTLECGDCKKTCCLNCSTWCDICKKKICEKCNFSCFFESPPWFYKFIELCSKHERKLRGCTLEEYEELKRKQKKICEVCRKPRKTTRTSRCALIRGETVCAEKPMCSNCWKQWKEKKSRKPWTCKICKTSQSSPVPTRVVKILEDPIKVKELVCDECWPEYQKFSGCLSYRGN